MHPGAGSSAVKLQLLRRASGDTRCEAAAGAWHAGRAAGRTRRPQKTHKTHETLTCHNVRCATDGLLKGERVAAGAADGSKSRALCNTRCRRDGYGTIDLGEMASVQVMMGRESVWDQKSEMDEAQALHSLRP